MNVNEDDFLNSDYGFDGFGGDRTVAAKAQELLTFKLLRQAIMAQNSEDVVMKDFSDYVLPNLLQQTIGVTAKGGRFFDEMDQEREASGQAKVSRRNAADQSLNAHLLNGLFPANLIEQRLEKLDTTVKRVIGEQERRVGIAGFILHDFEKFPDVPSDCRKLPKERHRQIISEKLQQLGLDYFMFPDAPATAQEYIDDLLFIAYNTQLRYGTNLNLSEDGLNPNLNDRALRQLADLACLADSLASIIKHPQDIENSRLKNLINILSNGTLQFTYHAVAENRGVLTNIVNNAIMEVYTSLNTDEYKYYEPLLYLPTGVIYLANKNAPAIDPTELPERVVKKIKQLCSEQLRLRQTGFGRDGKGIKYANYYNLFCDDRSLMLIALDATLRIISSNKKSVAPERTKNLVKFQQKGVLSADYDFQLGDDIRIDQLAEFGDAISRKIWGDRVAQIEQLRKQRTQERKKNKNLPELPAIELTPEVLIHKIAEFLGLQEHSLKIRELQDIDKTLKEKKLSGNRGGVPYEWYFLASKLMIGSGQESIQEIAEKIISYVIGVIEPIINQYQLPDGWDDLRQWVSRVVMLPTQTSSAPNQAEIFFQELAAYGAAKKSGRGKLAICSISHSPYSVKEQMETEVLFTPQVYTNKQMLGGSNAKRNISSIAATEIMLRQILMNQTQAVGKNFEDGKYRYLYFYPTYYFTPETNMFLQKAYTNIAQTRFDTSIRNHFVSRDYQVNFERDRYQSVDAFLIDEELEMKKQLPEDHPNYRRDRTFKLAYPEEQPLTFYFMALPPPGKDPTDTESWVMPTWLALALPMILDVKTVVSESPIPPFNDGTEFEESVFLDSAPQALRTLIKRDRLRLDYILEGWEEGNTKYTAPLNVLTAAYIIHLDINAKQDKGVYNPHWGKLTELAKDLETSPLYVFSCLKKLARNQKIDTPDLNKIKLYANYLYPCFDPYVNYNETMEEIMVTSPNSSLNHPQKLTELYRQFYRANRKYNPKANAVLKPIDTAADVILTADLSVHQGEALINAVAGRIAKLMDRVHASQAEGSWVISDRELERQKIMEFAKYFVVDVFEQSFRGDRARLAGQQLNLIRDTCEFLYRLEQDKQNQIERAEKIQKIRAELDELQKDEESNAEKIKELTKELEDLEKNKSSKAEDADYDEEE
jgi:CRISPR-associated protein Csc3